YMIGRGMGGAIFAIGGLLFGGHLFYGIYKAKKSFKVKDIKAATLMLLSNKQFSNNKDKAKGQESKGKNKKQKDEKSNSSKNTRKGKGKKTKKSAEREKPQKNELVLKKDQFKGKKFNIKEPGAK
ncbi:MAG: hypothetical protein SCK28_14465, partial [Bacillota bacterium]|nr:hypothetical protein [Bacillota bacterium]